MGNKKTFNLKDPKDVDYLLAHIDDIMTENSEAEGDEGAARESTFLDVEPDVEVVDRSQTEDEQVESSDEDEDQDTDSDWKHIDKNQELSK